MKRTFSLVVLLVGVGALVSCGSSSNPAFTGSWLFVMTPTSSSLTPVQASATLTQSGSQITGSATLNQNGTPCGTSATISGSSLGNNVTLQIVQEESTINFTGTANQAFTSISGTYSAASGPCFPSASEGSLSGSLE